MRKEIQGRNGASRPQSFCTYNQISFLRTLSLFYSRFQVFFSKTQNADTAHSTFRGIIKFVNIELTSTANFLFFCFYAAHHYILDSIRYI